jgi:hypothetical protein
LVAEPAGEPEAKPTHLPDGNAQRRAGKVTHMKRTLLVMGMVIALAMSTMAGAMAKGPHDKATGDITWVSALGATIHTTFDAHDGAPGSQPDRGSVTQTSAAGVTTVDLDCVIVDGDEAFFSGTNQSGAPVIFYADAYGTFGSWTNPGTATQTCNDRWVGRGTVIDGNLKIHSSTN